MLRIDIANRASVASIFLGNFLSGVDFGLLERPLSGKADIRSVAVENPIANVRFTPKADIRLILVKRSANDPKRTVVSALVDAFT